MGFILIFKEVYWLYHIRVPKTPAFVAVATANSFFSPFTPHVVVAFSSQQKDLYNKSK